MDIEQYRKNAESHLRGSILKKQIKSEIEEYEDQQIGNYETSKLKYKPLIEHTQEVKLAIDKTRDELMEQLEENRLEPQNLSQNMMKALEESTTQKGREAIIGLNIHNKYWNNNKTFLKTHNLEPPLALFQRGFQYKATNGPEFNEYIKFLQDRRGELAAKNIKTAKKFPKEVAVRKKYYLDIDTIIKALGIVEIKQSGAGIKKYNQTKRNAYKISQGKYGGLVINMPKLLNEMIIEAKQGGKIIYQDNTDKSLIELLTKRFNPKKKYSQKAIEIFNNLNMLANIDKHKSSGKLKLVGGNIYYTNPEDLFKKLQLITGSRRSGNNNIRLKNEAYQIIDKLLELNVISKRQYDKYIQQHLI